MIRRGLFAAVALTVLSVPARGEPARDEARVARVVLITIDTLRADHLGHAGYPRPTSPNLDALAAVSARFTEAYAHAPWTLPSLATIHTSRLPRGHGVLDGRLGLPTEATTLAERFAEAGWTSAAFVNSAFDLEAANLSQGFAPYVATARPIEEATEWLASAEEPFFLWIHDWGPHAPYWSAPEHRRGFVEGPVPEDARTRIYEPTDCGDMADPERRRQIVALYDSKIRAVDSELGPLLASLRAPPAGPATVIAVTSDHGEEFFEHGACGHGGSLHEEMLRVPMLLSGPGIRPRAIGGIARTLDLAPTLLALAGLAPDPRAHGISLAELLARDDGPSPFDEVVADGQFLPRRFAALRAGDRKVICPAEETVQVEACRAFDLARDPGEQRPVADAPWAPGLAARLEAILAASAADADPAVPAELDAAERERLRALGYLVED